MPKLKLLMAVEVTWQLKPRICCGSTAFIHLLHTIGNSFYSNTQPTRCWFYPRSLGKCGHPSQLLFDSPTNLPPDFFPIHMSGNGKWMLQDLPRWLWFWYKHKVHRLCFKSKDGEE